MRTVILHTFNWHYTDIINNLNTIHTAGYGAILIPPPLYSDPNGDQWWQRYQPKDYRVLLSHLGGKPELEQLISAAHALNPPIRIYADLVINHMANEDRPDRHHFPGAAALERYQANPSLYEENRLYGNLNEGLFSPQDFNHAGEINPHEWSDRTAVQFKNLSGLPDLKDSDWVLGQQHQLVTALVNMGFDGFRIDAVKHITERMLDNLTDDPIFSQRFWFAEVLTGSEHDQRIFLDAFLQETSIPAYDFPLFNTIRDAFSFGGSLETLAQPNALPHHRAITFVINHDIPHNDGFRFWIMDPQDEHLAYAYLLGRDGGIPLIYSDHNESPYPEDQDRWLDAYKRPDITAMIHFHNAVHGQPMETLHATDLLLIFGRGPHALVAINKSAETQTVTLPTQTLQTPATYHNLLNNEEITLSNNSFTLTIPPRTAQLWLTKQ